MKKKFADDPGWFQIHEKRYTQMYLEEGAFMGHVSLLALDKVEEPVCIEYGDSHLCIANDDYKWFMYFPVHRKYAVTASIDNHDNVVQWYIDIIKDMGFTETGIPYIEDLYLDIVYLPDGRIYVLDETELEEAYEKAAVSASDYVTAKGTAAELVNQLQERNHYLIADTLKHCTLLKNKLMA